MAAEPTEVKKATQRKFGSFNTVFQDFLGKQYLGAFLETIVNFDSYNFLVRIDNLKKKYEKAIKVSTDEDTLSQASDTLKKEKYQALDPIGELVSLDPEDAPLIAEFIDIYSESIAEDAPKLENLPDSVQRLGRRYKKTVLDPLVESTSPFKLKENWLELYNTAIDIFYNNFLLPEVERDPKELNFVTTEKKKFSIFGIVTYHVKDSLKGSFTAFKASTQSTQLVDQTCDAATPIAVIGSDPFRTLWPKIRDLRIHFYRYWISVEASCDRALSLSTLRTSTPYLKVFENYKSLIGSQDNFVDKHLDKFHLDEIGRMIKALTESLGTKTTDEASILLLQSLEKLIKAQAELKSSVAVAHSLDKLENITRRASEASAHLDSTHSTEAPKLLLSSSRPASTSPKPSAQGSPGSSSSSLLQERYDKAREQSKRNISPLVLRPSPLQIAKTSSANPPPFLLSGPPIHPSQASDLKSNIGLTIDVRTPHSAAGGGGRSYSVPSPKGKGKQVPQLIDTKESSKKPFFSKKSSKK